MRKKIFLFNFAASYSGGGFKRLYAFAKWFNQNGDAWFIINSRCDYLKKEFPNNHFIVVNPSKIQRLCNDCSYLNGIRKEMGVPDVYYSYGIPVYHKFGRVNWLHLNNILPLGSRGIPLSIYDRIKLSYLGWRIENNFKNVDIISAESNYSLSLINMEEHTKKLVVSVNGSDDELLFQQSEIGEVKKDNLAVVLGTYRYKALDDSYRVFEMLRKYNTELKLMIIGDEKKIPSQLKVKNNVVITGCLDRSNVIEQLRKSKYYISTTHIENSYNAASEGIFFADESYISDISPHRELVAEMPFERIVIPNMGRSMLRVKRENLSYFHLKTWDTVIKEMIVHASNFEVLKSIIP